MLPVPPHLKIVTVVIFIVAQLMINYCIRCIKNCFEKKNWHPIVTTLFDDMNKCLHLHVYPRRMHFGIGSTHLIDCCSPCRRKSSALLNVLHSAKLHGLFIWKYNRMLSHQFCSRLIALRSSLIFSVRVPSRNAAGWAVKLIRQNFHMLSPSTTPTGAQDLSPCSLAVLPIAHDSRKLFWVVGAKNSNSPSIGSSSCNIA